MKEKKQKFLISKIISKIASLSFYKLLILLALFVIIGNLINLISSYKNFQIFHTMLLMMLIISFKIIKISHTKFQNIKNMTTNQLSLSPINRKITSLQYSNHQIFIIVFFNLIYLASIFRLGYLTFNLISIYASILILTTFSSTLIGYWQYVIFLIYLNRILKEDIKLYNYYFPAKTDYIINIAELAKNYRNAFFSLGVFYTSIYALLIPANVLININKDTYNFLFLKLPQLTLNTPCNLGFYTSWIGILLFIIIAFPILWIIHKRLIKKIIKKLKKNTINDLQNLLDSSISKDSPNINFHKKFLDLIMFTSETNDYPLKDLAFYPAFMTTISLFIHISTIFLNFSQFF